MATRKTCMEMALGILARRGYSVFELGRKLKDKAYSRDEVEETLGRLVELKYVDDLRFSRERARYRAETSKWGWQRIAMELRQAGVDDAAMVAAKAEIGEGGDSEVDFDAKALDLVRRHFKGPLPVVDDDVFGEAKRDAIQARNKEKTKRVNFLLRRGFSMAQALKAVGAQEDD